MAEETVIEKALDRVREQDGNYVLTHVAKIEKEVEESLSQEDFLNKINLMKANMDDIESKVEDLNSEFDSINEEYVTLYNVAIDNNLIEEDEESNDDESEDDSE